MIWIRYHNLTKYWPSINNFSIDVIKNYNLISEHEPVTYQDKKRGFDLEKIWDDTIKTIDEYYEDKISYGDSKFYRTSKNYIVISNIWSDFSDKIAIRPGDIVKKIENNNSKLGDYYKLLKLYDRASIINDII